MPSAIASTGLKNLLLTNSGVREAMQGGVITLYPAPRPSHPNLPILVPALAYITQDGEDWLPAPDNDEGGLLLESVPASSILRKNGTWTVKGIRSGTATWFRWAGPDNDAGLLSTTIPRIDGTCGDDLVLASYAITNSYEKDLQAFEIAFRVS